MRHVEEIKQLRQELGRYMKAVADRQKQIDELKAAIDQSDDGVRALNHMVDSILAELALQYADPDADGVRTITLPAVSVRRNARDYEVHAGIGRDNESYVITVRRREAPDEKAEAEVVAMAAEAET